MNWVALCAIPIAIQGSLMIVDEGLFHRRRGLPLWERIGHPLDTLTVAAAFVWLLAHRRGDREALPVYVGLALFSCVFITKDELVHAERCAPTEHWLHAMLFVLHPIVLGAYAIMWMTPAPIWLLQLQLAVTLAFVVYQVVYWSSPWLQKSKREL